MEQQYTHELTSDRFRLHDECRESAQRFANEEGECVWTQRIVPGDTTLAWDYELADVEPVYPTSEPLDTVPPTIPTYWSKNLDQFVTIPE